MSDIEKAVTSYPQPEFTQDQGEDDRLELRRRELSGLRMALDGGDPDAITEVAARLRQSLSPELSTWFELEEALGHQVKEDEWATPIAPSALIDGLEQAINSVFNNLYHETDLIDAFTMEVLGFDRLSRLHRYAS
ncbi:MAG: hypothetical protein WD467_00535 [Candidatus Saccharimonadales bacterium]